MKLNVEYIGFKALFMEHIWKGEEEFLVEENAEENPSKDKAGKKKIWSTSLEESRADCLSKSADRKKKKTWLTL